MISERVQTNESKEDPRLVARVTFMRHEETEYTNEGRDISDAGIERAREKGRQITEEKGAPIVIGHSPLPRAWGTAKSFEEGARQVSDDKIMWLEVPGLQQTKWHDPSVKDELVKKWGYDQKNWVEGHYDEPFFYDNPEGRIETNEDKRERLYREFDRLLAILEKSKNEPNPPHLLFVTHFEIITLLLDDVFGIKNIGGPYGVPGFGGHLDLDIKESLESGLIPVHIEFEGNVADVYFDRALRKFIKK